ncbi:hypothetical protein N9U60_03270 [Betaproteobacteria bacterium]|nr:hypothetical protein [Betaproteobacteria bacterium]
MKLNQFVRLLSGIEEVMENDDVDIVVAGKDGGGGRLGDSDLKLNHISDIQFDRENKQIQIYYHDFNIVS